MNTSSLFPECSQSAVTEGVWTRQFQESVSKIEARQQLGFPRMCSVSPERGPQHGRRWLCRLLRQQEHFTHGSEDGAAKVRCQRAPRPLTQGCSLWVTGGCILTWREGVKQWGRGSLSLSSYLLVSYMCARMCVQVYTFMHLPVEARVQCLVWFSITSALFSETRSLPEAWSSPIGWTDWATLGPWVHTLHAGLLSGS